jgi:hypothetical protein
MIATINGSPSKPAWTNDSYIIYLESYYSFSKFPDVKPYPIVSYTSNLPGSPFTESLSMAFDALSVSSFLLMWIATAIFLSPYRHKMGRTKYFSLMSIPLIYYIFPFQSYFGDVFFALLQSSPISFSIIYILIFSATKQVGAVLFSLAFWTASTLVYDNRIRKSLLISSIGMAILFGSIEIAPLQYHIYPPYGLSILKTIGVSQMEKELEKEVKSVEERLSRLSPQITQDIPQLEEKNVKEILHDVLNELSFHLCHSYD